MKTHSILRILVSLAVALLLPACENPYIIHNLERPVLLTGIEIRSNVISADDPSHPLNEVFQEGRSDYTVTVPYDAEDITVAAFPEEGALASYEAMHHIDMWQNEIEFTIEANKAHRLSTLYTIKVLRGKPEAQLAGIELFVSDDPDPTKFEKYEPSNFIVNYIPSRGSYQVKLPNYTKHVALVLRSFNSPDKMVFSVDYRFQTRDYAANDGSKVTIGADGLTPDGNYYQNENTVPIAGLPTWWPGLHNLETEISLGGIHIYPGTNGLPPPDEAGIYFGVPAVWTDPDPNSSGKLAYISLTTRANNLDPKEYVLELRRELDYAYLGKIDIHKQTAGVTETTVNRLIGNFAPSVWSYDAALPKDTDKVVIAPAFESHTASAVGKMITYVRYYYDSDGKRYYVPENSDEHSLNPALPVQADPAWTDAEIYNHSDKFKKTDATFVEFAFDVQNYGIYKSMEVILKVEAAGKVTNLDGYKVMARRQTAKAVLSGIKVMPGVPVSSIWDSNGLSGFEANKQAYTVIAGSGRTHARINLNNTEGTQDRTITISSSSKTVNFHLAGGAWEDDDPATPSFGAEPSADIELKSRNTVVKITVSDTPSSYSTQEYTLNILSKNRNDIILPSDADSDGRMRAVFASGGDAGLTATSALPGDLIELTIEANLGYYVKLGHNTDGYKNGVHCKAEGFSMNDLTLVSGQADKKYRKYRFNMPDSNVEFKAEYEETAVAQNKIAYVAPRGVGLANRGGGYGTGKDASGKLPGDVGFDKTTATATSWGRASWDLQAVINSYDGDDPDHFTEIWLLEGTYRVPDPDDYTNAYYSSTDPGYKGESNPAFDCFPVDTSGGPGNYKAGPVGSYHVQKYNISGIQNKKDLAFVLRDGVQMYGSFKETDTDHENRHGQATETILTGVFADGETQAHHVVIIANTSAAMDGLTVSGGLGPELDDNYAITVKNNVVNGSRAIARQYGAGIHNINSNLILTNVNIRSNTATDGGGMYAAAIDSDKTTVLLGVEFFSNTALRDGGGMYTGSGSIRIQAQGSTWSFFSQNMAVRSGGALYNGSGSRLSVEDTEFFANSAQTGGGVYIAGNSSPVNPLDPPSFVNVRIRNNGASGSGAGIFNAAEMIFINVDFTNNYALGGSGGGLYNIGTAYLSNTSLVANTGGALYNASTALLAYTTIKENSGPGISNNGRLVLTNSIVNGNNGNGVSTSSQTDSSASALLTNVTIAGNNGDGVSNWYEGMGDSGQYARGHVNVLLTNVRITGNGGRGIYNRYSRFSGRGINLTLTNCTVASNASGGVRTEKSIGTTTNRGPSFGSSLYNESEPNKMTFPVYIRFHNSVVWGNGGVGVNITGGSDWFINNDSTIRAGVDTPSSLGNNRGAPAEIYQHSLIQGKPLYNGASPYADHARADLGNLDGMPSYSGLFASLPSPGKTTSGDFTPGSALVGAAKDILYPKSAANLTGDIFWKLIADSTDVGYGSQYPYDNGGLEGLLDTRHMHWINGFQPPLRPEAISHFLQHDNSFNVGDLRNNNWLEPNPAKSRYSGGSLGSGSLDIGAYQH